MKLLPASTWCRLTPVVLGLCLAFGASAATSDQPLHYLDRGQPDGAELLPPPPTLDSAEQAADMAAVVAAFHACTTNEAARAFGEKKFSATNFVAAIGSLVGPGKLPQTEAFLERVRHDAAAATDAAKEYWRRPRPFTTDPALASGKLEKSFSYPSGHATEGMVLALVLTDLFPEKSDGILAIGRDLGWHRVGIARHYPTDIYAGRVFARAIVRQFKANPAFQHDLAEAKAEIAAHRDRAAADPAPAPSQR